MDVIEELKFLGKFTILQFFFWGGGVEVGSGGGGVGLVVGWGGVKVDVNEELKFL